MAEIVAWSKGRMGEEDSYLANEAETAAYFGQLRRARELSRQAVTLVERHQQEVAARYKVSGAVREALYGNSSSAVHQAAGLSKSTGREVTYGTALALALAGNIARARMLVADLSKRFPGDTFVRFNYVPTVTAVCALQEKNPSGAIEALEPAKSYELGPQLNGVPDFGLYPVYVRGQAYLLSGMGKEAVTEFQKIIDRRGIVFNEAIGALAPLGLARAYALDHDDSSARDKARAAYQEFFALMKDADPEIPVLKQAKAEYGTLQ